MTKQYSDDFTTQEMIVAAGSRTLPDDKVIFAGTGLPDKDVADRVAQKARIFVNPGPQFGPGGNGFLRFNLATPRAIVDEALNRLDDAFADLR